MEKDEEKTNVRGLHSDDGVTDDSPFSSEEDLTLGADAPMGAAKIEAITTTWTKTQLYVTYAVLYLLYSMYALQSVVFTQVSVYATSSFSSATLLPTVTVVSGIVSAVIALPLAKGLDIWGRWETLAVVGLFYTVGAIVVASATNIATYFGAQVLLAIGQSGISYIISVVVSDISHLRHRAFFLALYQTPFIWTVWVGSPIAQSLVNNSTWRWGYGIFAILIPILVACVCTVLALSQRTASAKAIENPVNDAEYVIKSNNHPTTVWGWIQDFDVIGLILLAAGFGLLLLAVELASYNGSTWQSTHIIVMLVIGPLCLIALGLWEAYGASSPIMPSQFLLDRTILGASLLGAFVDVSFYMWDGYFSSFLQVVLNLSITHAGYVGNIYDVVSTLWQPIVGLIVWKIDRAKPVALAGIPLEILGAGLMIRYRYAGNIVAICFCQILIALGGGILVLLGQIAVMSVVSHEKIARVLAFKLLITYIGAAIGSAISGAVWNNTLVGYISENLPPGEQSLASTLASSVTTTLTYPVGSTERMAASRGYENAEKIMTIAATAFIAFCIVFVLMWKNVKLSTKKQVRGVVF